MPVSPPGAVHGFRPHLTLQTLHRGDGLLGMLPHEQLGPRGLPLSVMLLRWTFDGAQTLNRPRAAPARLQDELPGSAQAQALQKFLALGAQALASRHLQWRSPEEARRVGQQPAWAGSLWTLKQEEFFADFLADQVPELIRLGWQVEIAPGFAHHARPVSTWHMDVTEAPETAARVETLGLARRQGSWLLSLGIEVDGERLDLAPLLADLLRRDKRWLHPEALEQIDDDALVRLRAPGGRHVEAPARPLKAIMGAMLDLLTLARLREGPIPLQDWDASRLLQLELDDRSRWQFHGQASLQAMARRLTMAGAPPLLDHPPGLGIQLRPYQLHGLSWLQYLRAHDLAGILADDMGLGKTAQALAHIWEEKRGGRLDTPALVVLPSSLLFNWEHEAARVTPGLRVLSLHGPDRAQQHGQMTSHDLVLCPYALAWRDVKLLEKQRFHLLIVDEAQAVKNARTRTARALRRIHARHRLALTGTPLENHLGELWSQFDLLMPGFLGDARSFNRHWRKPIEVNGHGMRARLLQGRVRPFILRRIKADVAPELPPCTATVIRIGLQGHQRHLYESVRVAADHMVRRILAKQGLEHALISVLDAMLKLRQVCCDPFLLKNMPLAPGMERAKLDWLLEHLPDLRASGRRVLVFSQFTEMLDLLAAELARLQEPHLMLTGDTAVSGRADVVRRFQALEVPLMLVSLKAGGVGLNLTAADTVIHLDPWWNPAVQAQASARAHRIGQDKPVMVHHLVVQGSIEERMLALHARKLELARGVLGEDSGLGLKKFSQPDLDWLLAPLADEEDAGDASFGAALARTDMVAPVNRKI
ncbi:MAG: DEAD/DEAH box helicase [Burkholderiaceae bacterium]|nr:DEAD/DEAH box helicase [Burkholderiaceae bacterium]